MEGARPWNAQAQQDNSVCHNRVRRRRRPGSGTTETERYCKIDHADGRHLSCSTERTNLQRHEAGRRYKWWRSHNQPITIHDIGKWKASTDDYQGIMLPGLHILNFVSQLTLVGNYLFYMKCKSVVIAKELHKHVSDLQQELFT